MPPPAEPLATRLVLGPALRTQSDGRLVRLVREGYETAFEEIVRRYGKPLDRFAASIVGSRSEDVTQDAFSKALLALRGSEQEIELRPWLYRIVRNTALNDLRDSPPTVEQFEESLASGASAAVEAERREELRDLTERLQALPEPQRAAIVMRELEGLSHEEIAAALGMSGGAARQAIHRARTSLRNGLGFLIPLPLLRLLFDHAGEAAGSAAAAGATGTAAVASGLGAGAALKAGVATVLIAGSVGAGVAVEQSQHGGPEPARAAGTTLPSDDNGGSSGSSGEAEPGDDNGGRGEAEPGDDHGGRREGRGDDGGGSSGSGGPGPSGGERHGSGSGVSGGGDSSGSGSSGSGTSGGSGPSSGDSGSSGSSGSSGGPGPSGSGSDDSTTSGSSSGSGSSDSGSSGISGSGTSGSGSSGSSSGSSESSSGGSTSGGSSDDGL